MTVVFRVLHVLWAVPCIVVGIGLATAKGGHPPGIIFVPLVMAAWIVGHLSLGLTQWTLGRGLRAHGFTRPSEATWPPAILVCMVSCGIVFSSGLVAIAKGLIFDRPLTAIYWSLVVVWSTPRSALSAYSCGNPGCGGCVGFCADSGPYGFRFYLVTIFYEDVRLQWEK